MGRPTRCCPSARRSASTASTSWSSAAAFNAQTQQENGRIIPVEITVFGDRSFTFITKTPPAAVLIKEALRFDKGSPEPNREKVGMLTRDQVRQIAETKSTDLNARDVEQAMRIVEGAGPLHVGVEVSR